jgi:ATP-dependent RNA helicase RhlE
MNNYRNNNSGNRSRGGGFNRYGGGGGGRSNRGRPGAKIDPSRLIKKELTKTTEVAYVPNYTFDQLEIVPTLKQNIISKGYKTPTPIQDQAIPHILLGKDTVGIANTGTGKTGAFLIPLLHKVAQDSRQKVLIIAPTRELAQQIDDELYTLSRSMNIHSALIVGGASIGGQISRLRSYVNFVVGTPGRLLDMTNRKFLNLSGFQTIVLDEVDRMLDMGFINDIKSIISQLPVARHSLFFSATMTPEVERVMNAFVKDFVKVSVKTGETSDNVYQDIIRVNNKDEKISKLEELLNTPDFVKTIIFVRTKHGADKLDKHLYDKGFRVNSLHGDKPQSKRKRALESFKSGSTNVLVATDVAARGLDVPNITHVINFDMPESYQDYVHRIGRTGRASNVGYALTFVEGN